MKNLKYLIYALPILVPLGALIKIDGTDVWYSQYLLLFALFNIAISILLWDINKFISLLSAYCLFSTLYISSQQPRSIFCLIQLNFALLVIFLISKYKFIKIKYIYNAIIISFVFQSIFVLLQTFNIDPIFYSLSDPTKDSVVGLSGSRNQMGVFFSSTAPYIFLYSPIGLLMTMFALFQSQTTSAIIAFSFSMILFIYIKFKELRALFAIALVICLSLFFVKFENLNNESINERLRLYKYTLFNISQGKVLITRNNKDILVTCNPFTGFGIGNFLRTSMYSQKRFLYIGRTESEKPSHVYEHAHNDIIEAIYELGYIGGSLIFLSIGSFIYSFIRANKTKLLVASFCSVIAHIIASLGVYTIHTAVSGMILVISLGIFYRELRYGKDSALV